MALQEHDLAAEVVPEQLHLQRLSVCTVRQRAALCGPFFETILAYMPTQYFRNLGIHWLLPPVLALAWLVYAPGLSGGFLFDDFANLNALGNHAPIQNLDTLLRYLTSGTADPIGRPLSLASFLLNASDWPNNPGRFLQFNLLLHLANGTLLFALLRQLGGVLGGLSATCR